MQDSKHIYCVLKSRLVQASGFFEEMFGADDLGEAAEGKSSDAAIKVLVPTKGNEGAFATAMLYIMHVLVFNIAIHDHQDSL